MTEELDVSDVLRAVRSIFDQTGSNETFRTRPYSYKGKYLSTDANGSLLFEFPTLKQKFPLLYNSESYSLLLTLALVDTQEFSPALLNEISRIRGRDAIDKIVLWSTASLDDDTIEHLKRIGVDVISRQVPEVEQVRSRTVSNFVPLPGKSLEYSLVVCHIANYLIKRLRKLFHLVLSEIAAPVYDEHYASAHVATKSIMTFEEQELVRLVHRMMAAGKNNIAVDVGCGTGRHSFVLANHFHEVFAFDLSPQMVERAQEKKRQQMDRKILFSVSDFEYERSPDEGRFYGMCDLVVASFGMGSFVEDTVRMLRRFHEWLRPGGYVFISFYNENSVVLKLTPNWRDTSLASNVNPAARTLRVELPTGISFDIFCKPYNESTRGEINKIFNVDKTLTYPTVMALLPNKLLEEQLAHQLFSRIDGDLAMADEPGLGHYVLVVAHKPENVGDGYARVLQQLRSLPGDDYQIIEHRPVLSVEDVLRELGAVPTEGILVKTIIFKVYREDQFMAVSIPHEKRVDKEMIARILRIPTWRLKFASEKEVLRLGFPLGGIAPFGFDESLPIRRFVDAAVVHGLEEWVYTGVGNNRNTLRVRRESLLKLMSEFEEIEV